METWISGTVTGTVAPAGTPISVKVSAEASDDGCTFSISTQGSALSTTPATTLLPSRFRRRLLLAAEIVLHLDSLSRYRLIKGIEVTKSIPLPSAHNGTFTGFPRSLVTEAFPSSTLIRPLLLRHSIAAGLYPYQRGGVAWLLRRHRGLLADDMGLGKTAQVISALRLLVRTARVRWAIVVAPRTLVTNWISECSKWAPELTCTTLLASGKQRESQWKSIFQRAHIVVTTYEQLRVAPAVLLENEVDLVIADEAHRIRKIDALATKGIRKVPFRKFWALSGTPVERSATDLAVLMSTLDPARFTIEDAKLPISTLRARSRPYILRRRKEQVLGQIPPVIERDEYLPLAPEQEATYEKAIRQSIANHEDNSYITLFNELRSICDFDPKTGASSKFDRIQELLREIHANGERAIVFSYLLEPLRQLEQRLSQDRIGLQSLLVTGEMSLEHRANSISQFRTHPDLPVLLASSRVASEGLTLTEANHVLFINRWWNPSANLQARDRVVRIGQERVVTVYNFTTVGTVETRLPELLKAKDLTFDLLVNALSDVRASFDKREFLRELFTDETQ